MLRLASEGPVPCQAISIVQPVHLAHQAALGGTFKGHCAGLGAGGGHRHPHGAFQELWTAPDQHRLLDQVGGVLGDDAVAQAELADLFDQLAVGTVQPNLSRQRTRLSRRPQPRDEVVLVLASRELHLVAEALRLPGSRALHHQLTGSMSPITTKQYQLLTKEQIGQGARVVVLELHRSAHDTQIGESRMADLAGQRGDRLFDVVSRADIADRTAAARRHPIEQIGVDVVADTKSKDPLTVPQPLHLTGDPFGLCFANRRLAVGEKDDQRQPFACRPVGPAPRAERR